RPEGHLRNSSNDRYGGAQRPGEAAKKNRPDSPATKKCQRFFHLLRKARHRPDRERVLLIVVADPVRDPVAENGPHRCTEPNRDGIDPVRLDQNAKPDQDRRARNQERDADKGFAERRAEGDRESRLWVVARELQQPACGVLNPVKKTMHWAGFRGGNRWDASGLHLR